MTRALEAQALAARLTRLVSRDDLLSELSRAARRCDASLWLVGGIVRDAAMARATGDIDLVAGPGCARLVREIRRHWQTRGFRFRRRGVTTWRFKLGSRTVDVVDAARRGVEADLMRRDVTINAIAFDLTGHRILDPAHGLRDLDRGRLRATRDRAFAEDPLRVLRVCRFVSVFPDLTLEASSARSARTVAPRLKRSPPERVLPELDKLLLGSDPVRGLLAAERLGVRDALLPELVPLANCVAGRDRPDVWTHTLDALRLAAGPRRLPGTARVGPDEDRLVLRWAVLLHDIAKPETLEFAPDGRPTFHGHEAIGRQRADDLMKRLRFPVVRRKRIARLVLNHLRPGHLADSGTSTRALNRLLREMDDDLPLLVAHAACDARASGGPDSPARWRRLRLVLRSLLEHYDRQPDEPAEPLIDGRDVMRVTGLAPGPAVGRLLDRVRRQQRAGRIRTRREALAFLRRAGRAAARTPDLTDRAGREDP